jgi:hypothetical protein
LGKPADRQAGKNANKNSRQVRLFFVYIMRHSALSL